LISKKVSEKKLLKVITEKWKILNMVLKDLKENEET